MNFAVKLFTYRTKKISNQNYFNFFVFVLLYQIFFVHSAKADSSDLLDSSSEHLCTSILSTSTEIHKIIDQLAQLHIHYLELFEQNKTTQALMFKKFFEQVVFNFLISHKMNREEFNFLLKKSVDLLAQKKSLTQKAKQQLKDHFQDINSDRFHEVLAQIQATLTQLRLQKTSLSKAILHAAKFNDLAILQPLINREFIRKILFTSNNHASYNSLLKALNKAGLTEKDFEEALDLYAETIDYECFLKLIFLSNLELIKHQLIELGIDVNFKDINQESPLHWSVISTDFSTTAHLLSRGARVNAKNNNLQTPLLLASTQNNPQIIELLLLYGAEIDTPDPLGRTPLMRTAFYSNQQNRFAMIKTFVDHKANLLAKSSGGQGVLHCSATYGTPDEINFLITQGAPLLKTTSGLSPLHFAAQLGRLQNIQTLLEHHLDLNDLTDNQDSVLHLAVQKYEETSQAHSSDLINQEIYKNLKETIHFLLKSGVDPRISNLQQKTADQLTKDKEIQDMIKQAQQKWNKRKPSSIRRVFSSILSHLKASTKSSKGE